MNVIKLLKAPISVKIAVLGDSLTFGYMVEEGADYVSILKNKLKRRYPKNDLVVSADGVCGSTVVEALRRTEVFEAHPHLAIIQFGLNDASINVPLEDFEAALRKLIAMLPDADIILIPAPPVLDADFDAHCEPYRRVMANLCSERVRIAPLKEAFASYHLNALLQSDGAHPNELGMTQIAEACFFAMTKLSESAGGNC